MNVERAIIISLVLHLLLVLFLRYVPDSWAVEAHPTPAVEVELVSPPKKSAKERQVVRDAPTPEDEKDNSEENARFLSARQQRVVIETRARDTGMTHNGHALSKESWMKKLAPQPQPQTRQPPPPPKHDDFDGYEPIPMPPPQRQANAGFDDAPSTVGEQLPEDVSIGNFTALNTDRFKYYSFYARVEELVRFRWEQNIRQAVDSLPRNFVGQRDVWVTQIEFWLTPDGHFHSAHIFRQSGLGRLDDAAVNAFRDAAVFPHPPPELIGSDNFIHLQYSFNVHWAPGMMGQH